MLSIQLQLLDVAITSPPLISSQPDYTGELAEIFISGVIFFAPMVLIAVLIVLLVLVIRRMIRKNKTADKTDEAAEDTYPKSSAGYKTSVSASVKTAPEIKDNKETANESSVISTENEVKENDDAP